MGAGPINLREVTVRPVRPDEDARWVALMRQRHYLGYRKMCGAQLKQVALAGERWVALLGWQAAALHCAPRERWIGWSSLQRRTRLSLVTSNARFLVLAAPGQAPGLASRVLGRGLRRLTADWRARNGSALLLAESFVDPSRYAGTCYRAANWIEVGTTRGFGRVRGRRLGYVAHGQPKLVFVYPLRRGARQLLAAERLPRRWQGRRNRIHMTGKQIESLWEHLRKVPDFRKKRGIRHPFTTVLVIALAAKLAGSKNMTEVAEFALAMSQEHLRRAGARCFDGRYRPPSHNTLRRVLGGLDMEAVEREFGAWLGAQGQEREPFEPLGLDGKTMRGSYDRDRDTLEEQEGGEPPRQQLTAVGLDTRQAYGMRQFTGKKEDTEPQVARELLAELDIEGRCIVADALHTQRETAQQIHAAGAFYLFAVKANQPKMLEQLEEYDWSGCRSFSETDCGHDRIEVRTIHVSPEFDAEVPWLDLPGARVAARVISEVSYKKSGKERETAISYLLTNLPPRHASPQELLALRRGYWAATENGFHRVRDGHFQEDKCRARKSGLPGMLAALTNLAISIVRMLGVPNIAKQVREFGRDLDLALAQVLP